MDFKEHLLTFLDEIEVDNLLTALLDKDQHAVLLNPNKINEEKFLSLFPHVKKHPYVKNAFIYDKEKYPLGKSIYYELGYFYLQDPSSMITSSLIDFHDDDYVLDMCAAPGGKSIQASFKMHNNGLIISNDINRNRTSLISNNIEKLGIANILITNNDFASIYQQYENKFDVVILDAPCSGSGMFRKDDKMIKDWSINKVYKYEEMQKNLILIAYSMLKPGGLLSYSTCSYSKQENEDVIHYLLDNSDALVKPITNIKEAFINKNDPVGIRLMPSHFCGEGQYICHINKPGQKLENKFIKENKYKDLLNNKLDNFDVKKFNNTFFAISNASVFKNLNIVRYGLKVGEIDKNIFYYDLHYARYLHANDMENVELDNAQLKAYLAGQEIIYQTPIKKGYVLLTYQSRSVDIAKSNGQTIKNYYPKGLRKLHLI